MSVWNNPCYSLDPCWKAVRLLPKEVVRALPEYLHGVLQHTLENPGDGSEVFKGRTLEYFFKNKRLAWSNLVHSAQSNRRTKSSDHNRFETTLKEYKVKYCGIKAIYWAVDKIWNEHWQFEEQSRVDEKADFVKNLMLSDMYVCRLPINKQKNDINTITNMLLQDSKFRYLTNAREGVDALWTLRYQRSYKRRVNRTEDKQASFPYTRIPSNMGNLEVVSFPSGYILFDRRTKQSGIYFWKDHDRLVTTMNAIANLYTYMAIYDIDDIELCKRMKTGYCEIIDMITESMRFSNIQNCNKLCRALDVACNIYISTLANDINDRSTKDQLAKVEKEGLMNVIDVHKVVNVAIKYGVGVTETLELLKVYKLLPCPDFCPYSVVQNLKEKFEDRNTFDMNTKIKLPVNSLKVEEIELSMDEFKRYMKRNMILTFFNRHRRFPGRLKDVDTAPQALIGYPQVREVDITVENVDEIDISGSFQYKMYDEIEHELVKDKKTSIAWDNVKDKRTATNQVMQYLFDTDFLPQVKARQAFKDERYPWKRDIDIALKPEAKKPSSRAFFMAPDPARRVLSEVENNIARYINHKSGSSQGKNDMSLNEKMDELTNWEVEGCDRLMLSFDLASFSGSQDIMFKKTALDLWAEAFGESWISNVTDIFTNYTLKWDKFNINETLDLFGNDLEGFNGRLNTGMHLDVMGYAIFKLRKAGFLYHGGKMECLIDDGILSLQIRYDRFDEYVPIILKVIEGVYNSAGLKISWDKTYVSNVTCQYLNRIYCYGEEISGAGKAFLRIGKLITTPIPTLMDHLEAHASTTRGAMVAGCDKRVAYWKYCWEVTRTFWRWSGYDKQFAFSSELAASAIVPVALGGFGINSTYNLSSNRSFDPVNEGVSKMCFLGRCLPELADFFNERLNAGIRPMDSSTILSNPRSIRTEYRCLNLRRFANKAREVIFIKSVNPFVKEVADLIKNSTSSIVADVLANNNTVHDIVRSRLYQIDPISAIDKIVGKLQNSSTAASLLGMRVSAAITLVNRSEARMLLIEASKGLLVKRA